LNGDFVMSEYEVEIFQVRNRQRVVARLCSMTEPHLGAFERDWKPSLLGSIEEDQYWEWRSKQRIYGSQLGAESYAIEYQEQLQGLMLIQPLGHRSWFDPNRRIVYVHSLATAPWNRSAIQNPPAYRLVGSVLLEFARYRSQELGYGGLVGLHALPSAESFYRRLNMDECGPDSNQEGLVYFEWYIPQSAAPDWRDEVDWEASESDEGSRNDI
jgi:hypothetical protein